MCGFQIFRVIVTESHISTSDIVEVLRLDLVVQQPAGVSTNGGICEPQTYFLSPFETNPKICNESATGRKRLILPLNWQLAIDIKRS